MSKFVVSDRVFTGLRDAGLIDVDPKNVRRVIVDLDVGRAAKIYLETFADDRLPDVMARLLTEEKK